ncbi:MAG TPA: hypothetical protein VII78_15070 [Myxococcota bacterium]
MISLRSIAMGILIAASFGCATTRIENVWVDPAATPPAFAFSQVLVVAKTNDGVIRRATEDAMDSAFSTSPRVQSGQMAVHPAYTLLDDSDLANVPNARRKVEAAGYDGVVLVSMVSSEQRVSSTPPSYHGGFWGFYGGGAVMYDPGTIRTDTILRLQVSVYSLKEDKLLWSGMSRSMNPDRIDELVQEVAVAVREDLQKRQLIP